MSNSGHTQYLASKVQAAPPHRLHLMLIEGAIRFGRQAEDALRRGDRVAAPPALLRVLDIVGELVAGVRGKESLLNDKIEDFYWFLLRRVSEANIDGDAAKMAEVLKLLEYERETWQLVCNRLDATSPNGAAARVPVTRTSTVSTTGFKLEA